MKILSIFCILIFSSFAFADNSNFYDKDGKLFVLTHYSPPWSYKDCRGAEIDIIKLAFKESNIEISCVSVSYARLVESFLGKRALFASPVTKFDGEKVKAYYSEPFIEYVDVVVSYDEKQIELSGLRGANVIAYQKAKEYLGKNFQMMTGQTRTYREIPGRDNQMEMLAKGRADYIVGEQNILNALSKKLYPAKKLTNNLILKKWDIRAASHDKALMEKFNKGLEKIRKAGKIQEIYKQYGIL